MKAWFVAGLMTLACATAALACPPYTPIDDSDQQRFQQVLKNATASSADKIYAFDKLFCADKPHVRTEAADLMLGQQSSQLRGHALAGVLLRRERVIIEVLKPVPGFDKNLSYTLSHPNRSQNCIATGSSLVFTGKGNVTTMPCGVRFLIVEGTTVRLNGPVMGTFYLQNDNSVRGHVLHRGEKVDAKLVLFE